MVAVSKQLQIDTQGTAWITGANIKVIEIVLDKLTHGWSPEETLSYYYENQEQLDAEIERRRREAEDLAHEASDSGFRQKLLSMKQPR